uniref:Uncharacterized protein n=1 Tax=Anguilla anguilla TaxID=7936 RepID=A0A0E9R4W2_ANGAN
MRLRTLSHWWCYLFNKAAM